MAQIRWSLRFADSLEDISNYIAQDSPTYARSTVQKVIESIELIARFPRIGRVVPKRDDPNLREVIVFSYRVIYRIDGEVVILLDIVHGARQLPDDL